MDILEKDFKTSVLIIPKKLKDDVEKVKKMIYEQNENINKETENLKRNSVPESTTTMKISQEGFRGKFELAEERISKLEGMTMESTECEKEKQKE